jgi:hypothetical protein
MIQRRKVLVVAMLDSIHTARWLEQFTGQDIDFYLFPSSPHRRIHNQTKQLTHSNYNAKFVVARGMGLLALPLTVLDLVFKNQIRSRILRYIIDHSDAKFDIVHALETQHAGYMAEIALRNSRQKPLFLLSVWGSDLYWFKQFKNHIARIRRVLLSTHQLILECTRDIQIAYEFGYTGKKPVLTPASGGFNVSAFELAAKSIQPSKRKMILVKGYMGFVGRADVALRVIEEMQNVLSGYSIVVYSTDVRSRRIIRRLQKKTTLKLLSYNKHQLDHTSMLELFRNARMHIGISESDGMPGSLREAMLSGCFPIQSNTSCADEWVADGIDGFVVSVEDIPRIKKAIQSAIENSELIDIAAIRNREIAVSRLSSEKIQADIASLYKLQG